MKYQRAINRRLDDAAPNSSDDAELVLAARLWPEPDEDTLPRVVQREGCACLDEGWVAIDDDAPDED